MSRILVFEQFMLDNGYVYRFYKDSICKGNISVKDFLLKKVRSIYFHVQHLKKDRFARLALERIYNINNFITR